MEREEVPEIEKTDTDDKVDLKEDVDKEDVESDDDDFYTVKSRATTRSRDSAPSKASTGILIFSSLKTIKE